MQELDPAGRLAVTHPLAGQRSGGLLSVAHSIGTQKPKRDGKSQQQESFEDYFDHDLILYTTSVGMIHARNIIMDNKLQLVYWIGGGSGAGKSTVARRIAAEQGLDVYSTDDAMAEHARRSSPEDCPLLHKFIAMDLDERWVNRSPEVMFETFHWFQGEGFELILEDLLELPPERGVIVEGFRLLPHLVKPLLSESNRAVWMLPTTEFRETVIDSRGGAAWGFLAKTTNPERALRNLLERDRMFTDVLRKETTRLGLHAIDVNTATSEDDLTKQVTDVFGL
jgi:2-phosphoglycerate kinase